jgi:hypothetical protein
MKLRFLFGKEVSALHYPRTRGLTREGIDKLAKRRRANWQSQYY